MLHSHTINVPGWVIDIIDGFRPWHVVMIALAILSAVVI